MGAETGLMIDMYVLMLACEPTRAAAVSGGYNEGLNFGNVVTDSKYVGTRYVGSRGKYASRKK